MGGLHVLQPWYHSAHLGDVQWQSPSGFPSSPPPPPFALSTKLSSLSSEFHPFLGARFCNVRVWLVVCALR